MLIHGDLEIFDSTQIFEYFEDLQPQPALWPAEIGARARARLIELKSDEVYFPHIIRLMGLQETPAEPTAVAARAAAVRFYTEMPETLGSREFLAGPYSYADIAFYMAHVFGARMGAPMTERTPRLMERRDRITARPAVRRVVAFHGGLSGLARPPVAGLHGGAGGGMKCWQWNRVRRLEFPGPKSARRGAGCGVRLRHLRSEGPGGLEVDQQPYFSAREYVVRDAQRPRRHLPRNASTIAAEKAAEWRGCGEVTRLRSTTTGASCTQVAPAASASG